MRLSAHDLLFVIGSFLIPALLVILNFIVRKIQNWYYTAGSDFILNLAAVNLSSAVLVQDVSPYIRDPYLKEAASGIFVGTGVGLLIVWWIIANTVETVIYKAIGQEQGLSFVSQFKLFCSWACVVAFTGLEMMVFFYR